MSDTTVIVQPRLLEILTKDGRIGLARSSCAPDDERHLRVELRRHIRAGPPDRRADEGVFAIRGAGAPQVATTAFNGRPKVTSIHLPP